MVASCPIRAQERCSSLPQSDDEQGAHVETVMLIAAVVAFVGAGPALAMVRRKDVVDAADQAPFTSRPPARDAGARPGLRGALKRIEGPDPGRLGGPSPSSSRCLRNSCRTDPAVYLDRKARPRPPARQRGGRQLWHCLLPGDPRALPGQHRKHASGLGPLVATSDRPARSSERARRSRWAYVIAADTSVT